MIVEVGYGGPTDEHESRETKRRPAPSANRHGYNPSDPVKVVGDGPFTEPETTGLTKG
jgi:hypothetical protein